MRAMMKSQSYVLGVWSLVAVMLAGAGLGCSSSNNPVGSGGSGGHGGQGGQAGAAGQAGGGGHAGAAGGGGKTDGGSDRGDAASVFMAFAPCTSQSDYVSSPTTIAFGGTLGLVYSPNCLKVAPGTTVTWSGDFTTHPLTPSALETTPGNPIVSTASGTTASVTFKSPGFYGFFCLVHGDDQGEGMSGVIWVQ
jgi:plastocyanin